MLIIVNVKNYKIVDKLYPWKTRVHIWILFRRDMQYLAIFAHVLSNTFATVYRPAAHLYLLNSTSLNFWENHTPQHHVLRAFPRITSLKPSPDPWGPGLPRDQPRHSVTAGAHQGLTAWSPSSPLGLSGSSPDTESVSRSSSTRRQREDMTCRGNIRHREMPHPNREGVCPLRGEFAWLSAFRECWHSAWLKVGMM